MELFRGLYKKASTYFRQNKLIERMEARDKLKESEKGYLLHLFNSLT